MDVSELRFGDDGPGWVVGPVDHQKLRVPVNELPDLADVDAVVVFAPEPIVAHLHAQRARRLVERGEAWALGNDDVRGRLRCEEEQDPKRLGSPRRHLHVLRLH